MEEEKVTLSRKQAGSTVEVSSVVEGDGGKESFRDYVRRPRMSKQTCLGIWPTSKEKDRKNKKRKILCFLS